MSEKQLVWENVPLICQWCGKEFTGKKHQQYCCHACYKLALQEMDRFRKLGFLRQQKFDIALRYVERNNLKEVLKKYKPGKVA